MSKVSVIAHAVKAGVVRIESIKNIIAVTSGKGGVGKSTTAVNLAIALANSGASVGLLDADIYGPSVPILVGERDFKPEVLDSCFVPLEKYGIKILSFGFLVAEAQPAIWRGAIVGKALHQMLFDTKWGGVDYLIVDMPPGTGDIHLTMAQKMPITATISVTTPQDLALIDVTKSIEMYKKMGIPCLGIIENMSLHTCSQCGHSEAIFGTSGGDKLAESHNLTVLARLPLDMQIRLSSDAGNPIATANSNITQWHHSELNDIYSELAVRVGDQISKLPRDYSAKLGKINVVTEIS